MWGCLQEEEEVCLLCAGYMWACRDTCGHVKDTCGHMWSCTPPGCVHTLYLHMYMHMYMCKYVFLNVIHSTLCTCIGMRSYTCVVHVPLFTIYTLHMYVCPYTVHVCVSIHCTCMCVL